MSKTVDERVVSMRFDNKQFESGIKTSLDSISNLKKGLNFDGATKGLSDLGKIGKNFSLQGIADGIDHISSKFSALGIMGVTALANITNSAVNAGKKMIAALTIDPIKSGLDEYETKMGAIQTILTNTASKGTTLDQVNKALGDLNEYSDKTIYNFAEMAKNIGTFTAAGIDLDTSTQAIKGIANLAAGSGSTSAQASTAMYQLSQALAGGTVKLMDWNSVVNAGMGGELFQNALKETAKQMGIVMDESVPFRESLADGWITADVLTKTLERFAEDESLVKAATEVKTLTQMFGTMKETMQSGWAVSWENIIGDKATSTATLTAISEAFGAVVGASADARNEMLSFWNLNGGRADVLQGISNVLIGFASILKPIEDAFREIFPPMTGERLVAMSKAFKDLTANFKIGDKTVTNIKTTFKGLFSILDILGQVITTVVRGVGMLFGALLPAGDGVLGVTSAIGSFLTSLHDSIEASGIFTTALDNFGKVIAPLPKLFEGLGKIGAGFFTFAGKIASGVGKMGDGISKGIQNLDFGKIFDVAQGGLFATILFGIKKFIDSLTKSVSEVGGFLKGVSGILDGVRGSLEAYQNNLKAGTLLKIAIAIGILAASLLVLSQIDEASLGSALTAITILFAELIGSMAIFEKIVGGMGFKTMITLSTTLIAFSTAILMLSFALAKIAQLDWAEITKGIVTIAALSAILVITAKSLSKDTGALITGAAGYVLFATAMVILAEAVEKLGGLDIPTLAKGIGSIGILMAGLVIFVNKVSGAKMTSTAVGLTILAVAMLMFSKVIENLGGMPIAVLVTGLIALSVALGVIAGAMYLMQGALPGAAALLIIAGALAIIAPVLKILGSMSILDIGVALLSLAGVFAVLGVAALLLTPVIPAMIGLAAALALLGVGVTLIGGGLIAISAGFAALAVSGAAAAAGLVVVISSIIGLIPMFIQQVGVGVIAFANVIGDGAPAIVSAIMKVLTAMLDALITFIPKLIDGGTKLLLGILQGIMDNINKVVTMGIEIIVQFLNGVSSMIPKVIQAAVELMISFINGLADAIRKNTPTMVKAMQNIMSAVVDAGVQVLTGSIKGFADIGINIVQGLINGVKGMTSKVGTAMKNLGGGLLTAFKTKMEIRSPSRIMDKLGHYLVEGLGMGIEDEQRAIRASAKKGTEVTDTMTTSIEKGTPKVKKAATAMAMSVFDSTKEWIDKQKQYHGLSLDAELSKWQSIQKKYKEGSDERLQIDKRINELKQEMDKAAYDNSVRWINEEKYYNRLSLADELAAWERVQARYNEGSVERINADKEVYRVKNELIAKQKQIDEEYYNSTKAINEKLIADTKSLTDEYNRSVESRASTLANAFGLFDEVTENEDKVSGDELLQNLEDQVDAFDDWQREIKRLTKKGVDEGLIAELQQMGPRALDQIEALNELSTRELKKYVNLWQEKHESAKDQAILELEYLKEETADKIQALEEQTVIDLDSYKTMWFTKTAELTGGVVQGFDTMGTNVVTSVNTLRVNTEKEFVDMTGNIKATLTNENWGAVGSNIVQGITNGVKTNSQLLITEMISLAKRAILATEKELGIQSPSKEFERIGKMSNEGFAVGLTKFAGGVSESAKNVGKTAMSALIESIANISSIIDGSMDINPTIRPVMDLTAIQNGIGTVNSLFKKPQGLTVTSTNNKAIAVDDAIKSNTDTSLPKIINDLKETIKNGFSQTEMDMSGTLTIKVTNDRGEVIEIAETAIKDLLRRESR